MECPHCLRITNKSSDEISIAMLFYDKGGAKFIIKNGTKICPICCGKEKISWRERIK